MSNIKISIILPSLNVFTYIRECVQSVINQTLKDIEIICVDAGSVDGTLEILREYEKKDKRLRVIISNKKSYGCQMNLGMRAAQGEYIGIVETDDCVPKQMYEELYTVAKENGADLVKADFYRFTGNGNERQFTLTQLSNNRSYYGRVIDIEKEPECFSLNMVTCSGIYSRKFLEKNNIVYNETPGASYQDNGFWFQTFVYAKRALFINKPYYMIRRDNPLSSIYDKKKVNYICDEYRFILNTLIRDKKKFEQFKYHYAYYCYQSYMWNFNRIDDKYKNIFLSEVSKDFRQLSELKMLNADFFRDKDWNIIAAIIEDPHKWYERNILLRNQTLDAICKYEQIIIYGAGMVGKKVLRELEMRGKKEYILCFAVSQMMENINEYSGLQIRLIEDLADIYKKEAVVVVATTTIYHNEMLKFAKDLGFKNIILIPETDL